MRDAPLEVGVIDGRLVISIGVSTFCYAVQHAPDAGWPWDFDNDCPAVTVLNEDVFVKEVVRELVREEEDGTTRVHSLFDGAAQEAMEQGAEGLSDE